MGRKKDVHKLGDMGNKSIETYLIYTCYVSDIDKQKKKKRHYKMR